jgi:hypothetical protein
MNKVDRIARSDEFKEMWSIRIYTGNSPLHLETTLQRTPPIITRHCVTDIPASFVADPFMIRKGNAWYLFMEIMNAQTGLGEIGLVTSNDGIKWKYQQVVLREKYHLSYPFVFEYEGEYYMVPETINANAVRLYKAGDFPYQWQHVANLLEGQYADPTLFQYNNRWWMFAASSPYEFNTLNLFHSGKLTGPYSEHPKSPVIDQNNRQARPAGRINLKGGKLIRLCQDCYPIYGSRVRAFEITELTTGNYSEKELPESPILSASAEKRQWNSRGMHHMDAHQVDASHWMVCVDGCYDDN